MEVRAGRVEEVYCLYKNSQANAKLGSQGPSQKTKSVENKDLCSVTMLSKSPKDPTRDKSHSCQTVQIAWIHCLLQLSGSLEYAWRRPPWHLCRDLHWQSGHWRARIRRAQHARENAVFFDCHSVGSPPPPTQEEQCRVLKDGMGCLEDGYPVHCVTVPSQRVSKEAVCLYGFCSQLLPRVPVMSSHSDLEALQ